MLKWTVAIGDEKLKREIERVKRDFDKWFSNYWDSRCSKEKMLSETSPVEHIYYKMCKSFEEVKEKYPYEAKERCSSCGKHVDEWIETSFSFCDEYGCGMSLCKDCTEKLYIQLGEWLGE